jgi:protocatechuate 3,4-dioxygenase beta subunit
MPACASLALTVPMTEGPYFTPNSPERASLLEAGMTGTRLVLSGFVLTTDCKPVAHALLDFWQANAKGQYDNAGYILRGHQFTDESGHYVLTTVIPGLYPGRTSSLGYLRMIAMASSTRLCSSPCNKMPPTGKLVSSIL